MNTQQLITELYFNTAKDVIQKLTGYTGRLAKDFMVDHFVDAFNSKTDMRYWQDKIENNMPEINYIWKFGKNKNGKWILFQV